MLWQYTPPSCDKIASLSKAAGVSRILAEVLCKNEILDADQAQRFLYPRLAHLEDPFQVTHLRKAVDRLVRAIEEKESIVVFGDYDVDGVTSTAFFVDVLGCLGNTPHFVVPRRLEEGYGLSRDAIERALSEQQADLFVALDCGTNSVDEVAFLRSRGIDVIIVDHHRSKEGLPEDCVLINPHLYDSDDGHIRNLCTVGLVFKLMHGLLKVRRGSQDTKALEIKLKSYLDLVAMGTVADMVPLVEENRILARHGLRILQRAERVGLRSLMKVSGMRLGEDVRPVDVSFRLGPRINASGRLADASLSVELILNEDPRFCMEAASRLDDFNRERQEIEREITEKAFEIVDTRFSERQGFVLYGDDWHPGVVGIVASRLSRKYNRPCIVLGREGDLAKGSGRGINGVNLVEVLGRCSDLLTSWGGHPMAVGVSLKAQNVDDFQRAFDESVKIAVTDGVEEPVIDVAGWLSLEEIDSQLLDELDLLHPFGQRNPEPVFATREVVFSRRPDVFKSQHFRFSLDGPNRRRINGVAWKMADSIPPVGEPVDIAYQLGWNQFNGRRYIQMELVNWRPSSSETVSPG